MIAKKSSLILRNFFLLKQSIEFLPPTADISINIPEITDSYNIDIDFTIQIAQERLYQIFVKIEINLSEQKQFGYSIFSEGVGIFEFEKSIENIEAEKGNFLYFSGISICINSLRSIISNITSHSPFGKYTLPSIDVNELLKDKGILIQQKESK
jgi:preprotein translocase subunit SecB